MGYTIEQYHGQFNRVRRSDTVKYIVVHYVGDGNSSAGSAKRNCIYFSGGNRNASAHYFIDDGSIYEYADPSAYATWHVGDGNGKYGITNANSIGIEVCNNGGPFTEAEIDRLTWLVQHLMGKFGVPASRVVRHYDASRKECPLYYVQNSGAWDALRARITGGSSSGGTTTAKIDEDGYWGSATTSLAQQLAGTPVDGEVWGQNPAWKSRLKGCTYGWQFTDCSGSALIKWLQKNRLGVTADGIMGPDTINAFIRVYGNGICDGKLDAPSTAIKGFQKKLNSGSI